MKLSIVIPSYKEKHLQRTIDELLEKSELPDEIVTENGKEVKKPNIEIIVVLDGYWPEVPLKNDKRVKILHYSDKRGLRNAINMGFLSQRRIHR